MVAPGRRLESVLPLVPAGSMLVADEELRRHGPVLVGGSPLRLMRLSTSGVGRVEAWLAGEPVGEAPAERRLARRLLDAGMAHPRPFGSRFGVEDVTLVIPVRDDAEGLARALAGSGPVGEVVVVDDGSTEPLEVDGVRLVRRRVSGGPGVARNTARGHVGTRLIAYLDADCRPEPGWLATLVAHFDDPAVVAVAPRVVSAAAAGAIARYEERHCPLDMGSRPARVTPGGRVPYVPTAALVVRADTPEFDPDLRFGEDVDLVWRLVAAGGTVRYEPAARVTHRPRADLGAWCRQRRDYGSSAAALDRRHPGQLAPVVLSGRSAVGWALTVAGRPATGLAAVGAATASLVPRLRRGGVPRSRPLVLALTGQLNTARWLGQALRRVWWPLALPALARRRSRPLVAAALLGPALAELRRSPSAAGLRLLDDLAYGWGVWRGCWRERSVGALLPRLVRS